MREKRNLFNRSDGLSGQSVLSFLEDREGNIWVATERADKFRDFAIPTFSIQQGLSAEASFSILGPRAMAVLWLEHLTV
jgi:ligand-binding sensor domain-containing protein